MENSTEQILTYAASEKASSISPALSADVSTWKITLMCKSRKDGLNEKKISKTFGTINWSNR